MKCSVCGWDKAVEIERADKKSVDCPCLYVRYYSGIIKPSHGTRYPMLLPRIQHVTLSSVSPEILKVINVQKSAFLYGGTGVGKTHILAALYNRFQLFPIERKCERIRKKAYTEDPRSPVRVDWFDPDHRIIEEIEFGEHSFIEPTGQRCIIDDIGLIPKEDLEMIVRLCWNRGVKFWVSSNMSPDELVSSGKIEYHCLSRLLDGAPIVHVTGDDLREVPKTVSPFVAEWEDYAQLELERIKIVDQEEAKKREIDKGNMARELRESRKRGESHE